MADVSADPDELETGAQQIRDSKDEVDSLLEYMEEANPDWWMWGMPGLVFAPIYFAGVDMIRNQLEEGKEAIAGVASLVEKSASRYRETDEQIAKDIGEKGDTDDVKNPSGNGGGGNGGGSSSGGGGTGGGGGGGDDSGGGDSFEPDEQADSEAAEAARDFALAQDGKPYEWGGNGPDAFDCSGLMQQAWGEDKLPRTAQEQFNATERIDRDDLQPGDMLFFGEPGDVYHVAMYAGDGQMVHAANSDKGIVTQPVSEYVDEWNQPVAGYGRVQ